MSNNKDLYLALRTINLRYLRWFEYSIKPYMNSVPVLYLYLFSLALGIIIPSYCSQLLSSIQLLLLLGLCAYLFYRHRSNCYLATCLCFLLGVIWGTVSGHLALRQQLPTSWQPQSVNARVKVVSLPEYQENTTTGFIVCRFIARVIYLNDSAGQDLNMPINAIRINWYAKHHNDLEKAHLKQLAVGDLWDFKLRLKESSSYLSPGVFDYKLWLLQQGVGAQASVQNAKLIKPAELTFSWNYIRDKLKRKITLAEKPFSGLLLAILIGDRSGLTVKDWQLFQQTGTAHLIAISGLHVGVIAGFAYALCKLLLLLWALPLRFYPREHYCALLAITVALIYAGIAGLSLPTQRALIMLCCLLGPKLLRFQMSLLLRMLIAFVVIVIIDPWVTHFSSAYLSFAAVIILYLGFSGRIKQASWLSSLFKSQYYLFWIMLPLSIFFFQQMPIIALISNLLVIPLFVVIILPLALVYLFALVMSLPYAAIIYTPLNSAITMFYQLIDALAMSAIPVKLVPHLNTMQLIMLLLIGLLWIVFRFKLLLFIYSATLLASFYSKPSSVPLQMIVFDVGQGLAIHIRSGERHLLYDVGAAYNSGFNLADAVVVPGLRQQYVRHIDTIILSHADNDHAGAIAPLLNAVSNQHIILGDPLTPLPDKVNTSLNRVETCQQQAWSWNQLSLRVIYAAPEHRVSNNRSCVVLIEWQGNSILLTGDINKHAEQELIRHWPLDQPLTVLVAPHHGSRSSSSAEFIAAVRPRHVVFSSGYKHHYSHPHQSVVQRYRDYGARVWNTSDDGSIYFTWHEDKRLITQPFNEIKQRYWNIR